MALTSYSNLFTSGLLANTNPFASTSRRGSLPSSTDPFFVHKLDCYSFSSFNHLNMNPFESSASTRPNSCYAPSSASLAATRRSKARSHAGQPAYRSFLSLDLAESSASVKHSSMSMYSCAKSSAKRPTMTCNTRLIPHKNSVPHRTSSRESNRSIPSPKPVPSSTLPPTPGTSAISPPVTRSWTPSTPPLVPTSPASSSKSPSTSSSFKKYLPLPSIRSLSPIRFASPAPSSPEPFSMQVQMPRRLPALPPIPSAPKSKRTAGHVPAPSVASTRVSSGYRRKHRGSALARLEGKKLEKANGEAGNFMNMFDDEDEDLQAGVAPLEVVRPLVVAAPTPRAPWNTTLIEQRIQDRFEMDESGFVADDGDFIDLVDDLDKRSSWQSLFEVMA